MIGSSLALIVLITHYSNELYISIEWIESYFVYVASTPQSWLGLRWTVEDWSDTVIEFLLK